jgi:hypothetical protein
VVNRGFPGVSLERTVQKWVAARAGAFGADGKCTAIAGLTATHQDQVNADLLAFLRS